MRHRVAGKHLSRTSAHRRALRRNLAASLFEHGTISTTREKARFVRPFAERLITLARDGSLHARRRAVALLGDRDICDIENGTPVKSTTVIRKLFSEIGPAFADRPGGYTRIIKLPLRRVGDNGQLVLLQLVNQGGVVKTEKRKGAAGRRKEESGAEKETPAAGETAPVESETSEEAASAGGGTNDSPEASSQGSETAE